MHQSSDSLGAFGNHEVVTELFNGRSRLTAPKKFKPMVQEEEFINSPAIDWRHFIHLSLWIIRAAFFVQVGFDIYNQRLSYAIIGLLLIIAINTSVCLKKSE